MIKQKGKSGIGIFIVLLVIQCFYMVFWGVQKSGYQEDEFFSYANAHYISTSDFVNLQDSDFIEYNKWFDVSEIKSTLTVKEENVLYNDSIGYNIRALVQFKPYMALLNYVEAIFFEGKLNWWSGISLNIVLFALNQIVLYMLARKVCRNRTIVILSISLYGFCGMAVSMVVNVQAYMYVTFLMTLFTYIHAIMWKEKEQWKNMILEIVSIAVLYVAYRTEPIAGIYGIIMIIFFSLGLWVNKRWEQIEFYSLPMIFGLIWYISLKTDYIDVWVNSSFTFDVEDFANGTVVFLQIVSRYLFGHVLVFGIYIIMLIGIIYFTVQKKKIMSKDSSFFYPLFGATMAYVIILICFNLSEMHNYSFVFSGFAISFLVVFDNILDRNDGVWRIISIGLMILILGEVVFTCTIPSIENLYIEDREGVISIQGHKGIDSVVVDYHGDDSVLYECVAYTDEDTKVILTLYGTEEFDKLGDVILVWQNVNKERIVLQDLYNAGYNSIDEVGKTHESIVYVCKK